jgi:L-histidine N-alpha-methyltransferase
VGVLDSVTSAGPDEGRGQARRLRLQVLITEADRLEMLRAEARRGLTRQPKELPPKWFYDERGSALFDEITRLPEYYLTRREREILNARAPEIAAVTGAETLIELGSGSSEKTRTLLDALDEVGTLRRFVPFDVCLPALEQAGAELVRAYPPLEVQAVVGDFDHHVGLLPREGRTLVAFLGSTIGNFDPPRRAALYARLFALLAPGDFVLLGTDLVKDEGRLHLAYNDAAGVTAAFNRNVLRVLNRDLGADFVEDRFQHVATFDAERSLIDIRLRSLRDQTVSVAALDLRVRFGAGEEMRTEISTKFRRRALERELAAGGFSPVDWWTDVAGDFALSLWKR